MYLNWIVEGPDGNLYQVPAEMDGWSHRTSYNGLREQLRQVEGQMANAIIEMLRVDGEPFQRSA